MQRTRTLAAPSAVSTPGVSVSNDDVTATFSAPSSDGGSPITGYSVQLFKDDTFVQGATAAASATSHTFNNLADGLYKVRAAAFNDHDGDGSANVGPFSGFSVAVRVGEAPAAPKLVIRITNLPAGDKLNEDASHDFNWSRDADNSNTSGAFSNHRWTTTYGSITSAGVWTKGSSNPTRETTVIVRFTVTQGMVTATASYTFVVEPTPAPTPTLNIAITGSSSNLPEDQTRTFGYTRVSGTATGPILSLIHI